MNNRLNTSPEGANNSTPASKNIPVKCSYGKNKNQRGMKETSGGNGSGHYFTGDGVINVCTC